MFARVALKRILGIRQILRRSPQVKEILSHAYHTTSRERCGYSSSRFYTITAWRVAPVSPMNVAAKVVEVALICVYEVAAFYSMFNQAKSHQGSYMFPVGEMEYMPGTQNAAGS